MSRLWSRLGARTAAVALLSVGVAGGFYLGESQETEQQGTIARVAVEVDKTEHEYQRERQARHQVRSAQQRGAEYQAKLRAAKAAKEAAERAKEAERAAATRKKEREAAERKKAEEEKAKKEAERADSTASRPFEGPVPDSCTEFSGNRRTGCSLMVQAGFGMDQFPCLNKLWNKESGWNHKARNPSSGAYGIPQSLPGSKMASVGSDWESNPATQIKWGLNYIDGRYGSPCKAWQHSQNVGWY
ncbi:lytic transglycosylase domain-containing protein [Micromonospora sp. NPDC000207]|uniref:aggregation-promoting factor C-terminal-like domain-containing protein n=1 Tax=Micromonospora sp. NPDC000207 TaxID=3154246 RepID=UPI0033311B5F